MKINLFTEILKKNNSVTDFMVDAESRPGPAPQATTSPAAGLSQFVTTTETLQAEVLWALKVLSSHYSFKSCEDVGYIFRHMFPDSQIADKFSCGEKKCAYISCFGIAPYFHQQLLNSVKSADGYVLLFDESMSKSTQSKQLDIHVRFWWDGKVTSRYLTSQFVGHSTAEDLLNELSETLTSNEIDKSRILQLSIDGPNVNIKLHDLLEIKKYLVQMKMLQED